MSELVLNLNLDWINNNFYIQIYFYYYYCYWEINV